MNLFQFSDFIKRLSFSFVVGLYITGITLLQSQSSLGRLTFSSSSMNLLTESIFSCLKSFSENCGVIKTSGQKPKKLTFYSISTSAYRSDTQIRVSGNHKQLSQSNKLFHRSFSVHILLLSRYCTGNDFGQCCTFGTKRALLIRLSPKTYHRLKFFKFSCLKPKLEFFFPCTIRFFDIVIIVWKLNVWYLILKIPPLRYSRYKGTELCRLQICLIGSLAKSI